MSQEAQDYEVKELVTEVGKTRWRIVCPYCNTEVWAFIWSLAGKGKRCPGCGALHTWRSRHGDFKTVREVAP
jgi:hypothetical protein